MTHTIAPPSSIPVSGLAKRFLGVVTSPRSTYGEIAAHPRWLGALVSVVLVMIAASMALYSTEVGRLALLDQQIRSLEAFGHTVSDAEYARLQGMAPSMSYIVAASQLVFLPLGALALAGVLFAVFNGALGADAPFRQTLAVVTHSGVLIALQQLLARPLHYARETVSSPTSLGVFLPFLDENTLVARLVGSIDLFVIWWALNLAIGLSVLYRRRTRPIATGMVVAYGGFALVIATIRTVMSSA